MLCAHLDVVPVELENWNYDPFGGQVEDGFIYGRGTIDAKNIVMVNTTAHVWLNYTHQIMLIN